MNYIVASAALFSIALVSPLPAAAQDWKSRLAKDRQSGNDASFVSVRKQGYVLTFECIRGVGSSVMFEAPEPWPANRVRQRFQIRVDDEKFPGETELDFVLLDGRPVWRRKVDVDSTHAYPNAQLHLMRAAVRSISVSFGVHEVSFGTDGLRSAIGKSFKACGLED